MSDSTRTQGSSGRTEMQGGMSDDVMRGVMGAAVPTQVPAGYFAHQEDEVWQGMRVVGAHTVHYTHPDDRSLDNFSPLAQPMASIQWYCKPHRPQSVVLMQPWTCYKAVVYRDAVTRAFRVGIMQLTVPAGQPVVISRAPGRKSWRGLNYRVRVHTAVVGRCFRVENSKSSEDAKELFEVPRLDFVLADELQVHKCDVFPGMQLSPAESQLHLNPQVFDGAGVSIEPLLSESLRVYEYFTGQLKSITDAPAPECAPPGSFLEAVLHSSAPK